MQRYSIYLWPILGLLTLLFCSWLLVRELDGVGFADIWVSLKNIPPHAIFLCFLSTLVAYTALAWYDRIALMHLGHKISWWFISVTSFTTYAISHNIGLSMLSGGVIRYRAYATKGLRLPEVAFLVVFCSFSFALGAVMLGGIALLWEPTPISRLLNLPPLWLQITGGVLLMSVVLYGLASFFHFRPLQIGSFHLVYPRPDVMMRQMIAGPLELLGAAGILYFALPAELNVGFLVVLGVFVASFSAAILSHSPGGLGVLEVVCLKALPDLPHADVLAALIIFRLFYLLLPLLIGICVVLKFEHGHLRSAIQSIRTQKDMFKKVEEKYSLSLSSPSSSEHKEG